MVLCSYLRFDEIRKLAKNSLPVVVWVPFLSETQAPTFDEVVGNNNKLLLPFVLYKLVPELLRIGVDVICKSLGKAQPNHIR